VAILSVLSGLGIKETMRHFFIDSSPATNSLVAIQQSEAHHIKNVLRLRPGDRIKLFDGTGFEYEAVIRKISAARVDVEILSRIRATLRSGAQIIVAQAFLKEKKMDDLVRKLCELGVTKWIPFFSQRSIARPDASRLVGRTRRWHRIAAEALKQCRRIDLPEIATALSFEEVLDFSKTCDLNIVFWENESTPLTSGIESNEKHPIKKILLMLGPEGGFTHQEIQMAENSGFVVAGLGPRILRAETATLAACAIVQHLFGDMG
jgi:16S rRNA (uracil1498-N3)-methyltransferase